MHSKENCEEEILLSEYFSLIYPQPLSALNNLQNQLHHLLVIQIPEIPVMMPKLLPGCHFLISGNYLS